MQEIKVEIRDLDFYRFIDSILHFDQNTKIDLIKAVQLIERSAESPEYFGFL